MGGKLKKIIMAKEIKEGENKLPQNKKVKNARHQTLAKKTANPEKKPLIVFAEGGNSFFPACVLEE